MISFVWSSKYPFIAGSGGSETYTAGQIRELIRRGIPTRIITIGFGEQDGREDFPDIPFFALESKDQLGELDDLLVYITYPLDVKTRHQPYAILHCPPPTYNHGDPLYVRHAFKGVRLITASKYAAGIWRRYLKTNFGHMPTVYPFADEAFDKAIRPHYDNNVRPLRILYAGRLIPDKGIYTLLSSLHMEILEGLSYKVSVTSAGSNTNDGAIILKMLEAHPGVRVLNARKNVKEMAELLAKQDIVVMPSTNIFWQELFGMLSIEAQHTGCRVVASRSGGLPETNLGGVVLVRPDDPQALAAGLAKAIALGPLTGRERQSARRQFTVTQSVDSLLKVINYDRYKQTSQLKVGTATLKRTRLPRGAAALQQLALPQLSLPNLGLRPVRPSHLLELTEAGLKSPVRPDRP